jgi:hypothetical protein
MDGMPPLVFDGRIETPMSTDLADANVIRIALMVAAAAVAVVTDLR